MLKQRVITAILLIPLVLAAIFFLPDDLFMVAVGLVFSVAAYEFAALIGLKAWWQGLVYVIALWLAELFLLALPAMPLFWLALVWWLVALMLVARYPRGGNWLRASWLGRALIGVMLFVPAVRGIQVLHSLSPYNVLYLLLIIWAADVGAYFVGMSFGRAKLAPEVSPNKSIEGLLGGVALAVVVMFVIRLLSPVSGWTGLYWLLLTILVVLMSVVGDLFESMLKRIAGVKDSGAWLPGHGGMLDRIDSLLAATPLFALGVVLIILFSR